MNPPLNLSGKRLKILIVFYTETLAQREELTEFTKMVYIGPLQETGLADVEICWYGPWMYSEGDQTAAIDWAIFKHCAEFRPDAMYYINGWLPEYTASRSHRPRLVTFYLIKKLLGTKIVPLWTDQAYESFEESDTLMKFCDFGFTHEPREVFVHHSKTPDKYTVVMEPLTEQMNGDPAARRDIDVLFIGGIEGYSNDRANGISALERSGIPVTRPGARVHGGKDKSKLSNEEYTSYMKRAKIVLNWSRSWSGRYFHAKNRIFEATLGGALLFCEECPAVNEYFTPHVDYVPFSGEQDLISKVNYYLTHSAERLAIAQHGHKTAIEKYNAKTAWGQRLEMIQTVSMYDEQEALNALQEHASGVELLAALTLQSNISRFFTGADTGLLQNIVTILHQLAADRSLTRAIKSVHANKVTDAMAHCQIAYKLNSQNENIALVYASLLTETQKKTEAQKILTDLISAMPNSPIARTKLAKFAIESGDNSSAREHARAGLLGNPENKELREILVQLEPAHDLSAVTDPVTQKLIVTKRPCSILFRYKHVPNSKFNQEAHEKFIISNPYKTAGIGSLIEFYLDDVFHTKNAIFEHTFLNVIRDLQPDAIFLSSYEPLSPSHPNYSMLQAIRMFAKIPLITFWHDTCGQNARNVYGNMITSDIDLHIPLDSDSFTKHYAGVEFLRLQAPPDHNLFWSAPEKADIPLSFIGSSAGYRSIRKEYTEFLQESGVPVYFSGGQVADTTVSWEEYASILRRSKISLNFSQSIDGEHQMKARVLEVMYSGALLLESENEETRKFFTPGVHYVSFNSKLDLLDKVKYYLSHEDERLRIAENGYRRATTEYNATTFWTKIFDKLAALKLVKKY